MSRLGDQEPRQTPQVKTLSLVDSASHRVASMILDGTLKTGDRLPPERELATQLGTILTWDRGGVTFVLAGSVPNGAAETAAANLR